MRDALSSPALWWPLGAVLLFLGPALVDFDGVVWSPESDLAGQYLPYLDHLAGGAGPPARNPVPFAGIAAMGNPNAPVAYPPVALYLVWPRAWLLTALLAAHLVLMAAGNTPIMHWNIFNGFRTLSANIATELPEAVEGSAHYRTLFLAALILFGLTFIFNSLAEIVRLRFRKKAVQL